MKISLIIDIEGVSGSVWGGFGLPSSGEDAYYTEMMTAEVDTVVRALLGAGVERVVVLETHKLQPGVLPETAVITRNREDIAGADALFFVGQHGMAHNRRAVYAHTMNSRTVYRTWLNGIPAGELTLLAAYAGAMGIPTVFAAGEAQTGVEARRNLPPIEFVCDEIGLSNHSAVCRPFKSIEKELRERAVRALERIPQTPPFDLGHVTMKFEYRYHGMGERVADFSFVRRAGDAVVIEAPNMVAAMRLYRLQVVGRDFWSLKMG